MHPPDTALWQQHHDLWQAHSAHVWLESCTADETARSFAFESVPFLGQSTQACMPAVGWSAVNSDREATTGGEAARAQLRQVRTPPCNARECCRWWTAALWWCPLSEAVLPDGRQLSWGLV